MVVEQGIPICHLGIDLIEGALSCSTKKGQSHHIDISIDMALLNQLAKSFGDSCKVILSMLLQDLSQYLIDLTEQIE